MAGFTRKCKLQIFGQSVLRGVHSLLRGSPSCCFGYSVLLYRIRNHRFKTKRGSLYFFLLPLLEEEKCRHTGKFTLTVHRTYSSGEKIKLVWFGLIWFTDDAWHIGRSWCSHGYPEWKGKTWKRSPHVESFPSSNHGLRRPSCLRHWLQLSAWPQEPFFCHCSGCHQGSHERSFSYNCSWVEYYIPTILYLK